ncbi:hypothetical protein [Roseisolibacter sp. H3M3-2]|nr:hypothetical protein [Roseisolibacter sp. H3M3-2]MDF1502161.1 hypothetical protein [Roseisolibacter sp. H3M3-2]
MSHRSSPARRDAARYASANAEPPPASVAASAGAPDAPTIVADSSAPSE